MTSVLSAFNFNPETLVSLLYSLNIPLKLLSVGFIKQVMSSAYAILPSHDLLHSSLEGSGDDNNSLNASAKIVYDDDMVDFSSHHHHNHHHHHHPSSAAAEVEGSSMSLII